MALLKNLIEEILSKLKEYHFEDILISEEQKKLIAQSITDRKIIIKNNSFLVETSPNHYVIMPFQYIALAKICFPLACCLKETFDFVYQELESKALNEIIELQKGIASYKDFEKLRNIIDNLEGEIKENVIFLIEDTKYNKSFANTGKSGFRKDLLEAFILNVVPLTTASNSFFGTFIAGLVKNKKLFGSLLENIKIKTEDFPQIPAAPPTVTYPHNRIVFGAPGTGKSYRLKDDSSCFKTQDIAENPKEKLKKQYSQCRTNGDFIRFGMCCSDYKEKSTPEIASELNTKKAYFIKKGTVLLEEIKNIPEFSDEEFSDKIGEFIKSIPHGKKETLGLAVGYKYANQLTGLTREILKTEYNAKPTVADWIINGVQAAQSEIDKHGTSEINFIERVTFHPNYSYAQFVGTYKPVQDTDDEKQISYQYVPGPFMRVYAAAKQNQNQNFLLIVEEINRANVAAVFGDIFQLLDREDGVSEYPVAASEDIKKYLKQNGIDEDKLSIPSNMYIWATMNSADQGVFPMDTAFKRRWEFEYIGIDENEEAVKEYWIPINDRQKVRWNDLRKAINEKLISMKINEDKLLGPFFLSRSVLENAMDDGEKFIRLFKSKVLMYLFEDAAKMKPAELFDVEKRIFSVICNEFDEKGTKVFKLDAEIEVLDIEESNSIEEEQEEPQE